MRLRRLLPALAFILSISLLALLIDPPPEQASASSIPHDVELTKVNGGKNVAGPVTKLYTVKVRNNGGNPSTGGGAENIQVALRVDAFGGCPAPTFSPSSPQSVTVSGGAAGSVIFSVTFGNPAGACSAGNNTDYLVTADACHAGDTLPVAQQGLFGPNCPGTNDGGADTVINDQPITMDVNDTTQ